MYGFLLTFQNWCSGTHVYASTQIFQTQILQCQLLLVTLLATTLIKWIIRDYWCQQTPISMRH